MNGWSATRKARYRAGAVALRTVLNGPLATRTKVEGIEKLPDAPSIIATNHISYIDAYTIGLAMYEQGRTPIFMARSTLADSWLIGGFLRAGAVLVDSENVEASKVAWAEAAAHLKDGRDVIVAPEHAISKSLDLLPMKTGAARISRRTGAPLVPVANFGTHRLFENFKFRPTFGASLSVTFGNPLHVAPNDDPIEVTERMKRDLEALIDQTLAFYPDKEDAEGQLWWPKRLGGGAPDHDTVMAGYAIDRNVGNEEYLDADMLEEVASALSDLDDFEMLDNQQIAAELAADLKNAAQQLGSYSDPLQALSSMLDALEIDPDVDFEPETLLVDLDQSSVNLHVKAARPTGDFPAAFSPVEDGKFKLVLVDPDEADREVDVEETDYNRSKKHRLAADLKGETLADHIHVQPHLRVISGGQDPSPLGAEIERFSRKGSDDQDVYDIENDIVEMTDNSNVQGNEPADRDEVDTHVNEPEPEPAFEDVPSEPELPKPRKRKRPARDDGTGPNTSRIVALTTGPKYEYEEPEYEDDDDDGDYELEVEGDVEEETPEDLESASAKFQELLGDGLASTDETPAGANKPNRPHLEPEREPEPEPDVDELLADPEPELDGGECMPETFDDAGHDAVTEPEFVDGLFDSFADDGQDTATQDVAEPALQPEPEMEPELVVDPDLEELDLEFDFEFSTELPEQDEPEQQQGAGTNAENGVDDAPADEQRTTVEFDFAAEREPDVADGLFDLVTQVDMPADTEEGPDETGTPEPDVDIEPPQTQETDTEPEPEPYSPPEHKPNFERISDVADGLFDSLNEPTEPEPEPELSDNETQETDTEPAAVFQKAKREPKAPKAVIFDEHEIADDPDDDERTPSAEDNADFLDQFLADVKKDQEANGEKPSVGKYKGIMGVDPDEDDSPEAWTFDVNDRN